MKERPGSYRFAARGAPLSEELTALVRAYNADADAPDEITAVEAPKALRSKTKRRSGEYVRADVADALKESKT